MTGKISTVYEISGKISSSGSILNGNISTSGSLEGKLSSSNSGYDVYDGPYRVSSSTSTDRRLDTKGKMLKDDLIVNKILYISTDNLFDGLTVYIGEE